MAIEELDGKKLFETDKQTPLNKDSEFGIQDPTLPNVWERTSIQDVEDEIISTADGKYGTIADVETAQTTADNAEAKADANTDKTQYLSSDGKTIDVSPEDTFSIGADGESAIEVSDGLVQVNTTIKIPEPQSATEAAQLAQVTAAQSTADTAEAKADANTLKTQNLNNSGNATVDFEVADPESDQNPETYIRVFKMYSKFVKQLDKDLVFKGLVYYDTTNPTPAENECYLYVSEASTANYWGTGETAEYLSIFANQSGLKKLDFDSLAAFTSQILSLSSPEIGVKYSSAGYYAFSNGVIQPTFNFHTPKRRVTEGQIIGYKLKSFATVAVIAAFDKDGNYIQANSLEGNGDFQEGDWIAASGTFEIAFSGSNTTDWEVYPYNGEVKDNTISGAKLLNESLASSKLNTALTNRVFGIMDSSQIGTKYSSVGYYRYSDGNTISDFQNKTPLFKVVQNQTVDYILNNVTGVASIAAFDKDGAYIQSNSLEGTGSEQSGTWIADTNTSFVGFCNRNGFAWKIIPFYAEVADESITSDKIADNSITTSKIVDGAVLTDKLANRSVTGAKVTEKTLPLSKLSDSVVGKNKFNLAAEDIQRGVYISATGVYTTFNQFSTTGLIAISSGETMICNTAKVGSLWGHNLYNSLGVRVSTVIDDNKVTASEDGYCEFTISVHDVDPLDTTQVELGESITDYEAYKIGISEDNIIESTPAVDELALPSEIVVCQNTELNIYANTLRQITDEAELNSVIWMDKEGTSTPKGVYREGNRYQFAVADADEVGTSHNVRVSQKKINGETYDYKDVTVRVVANNIKLNNRARINIAAAGDSISERGMYELELLYKFAAAALDGGSNIRYFGAKANYAAGHPNPDSYPLPIETECRGGWKTEDFLTAISDYGSQANPYWNPNKVGGAGVDIAQYVTWLNTGTHPEYPSADFSGDPIDQIDVHFIMLGTNDTGTKPPEQLLASLNEMADNMWEAYPDCVIVFVTLPPRGLNSTLKSTVAEYNQYLINNFVQRDTGTGRSYLLPIHTWIDREFGYGLDQNPLVSPNNVSRLPSSVTTYADSPDYYGDLHPWYIGHMQMADAIFCGLQDIFEKHNVFLGV